MVFLLHLLIFTAKVIQRQVISRTHLYLEFVFTASIVRNQIIPRAYFILGISLLFHRSEPSISCAYLILGIRISAKR
jgi:hypothetical protein